MKILLGPEAKEMLEKLSKVNWISKAIDPDVKGGVFECEIPGVYIAFDTCNGSETFVEEFDNLVEAAKYASGVMANTRDGNSI